MNKTPHENIVYAIATASKVKRDLGVVTMGKEVIESLNKELTSGGFFIWDLVNCDKFYSPNFIKSLGFKDESEFPYVAQSWKNQVFKEYQDIIIDRVHRYLVDGKDKDNVLRVEYHTKNNNDLEVFWSDTIIKSSKGEPTILVGTHVLIKK